MATFPGTTGNDFFEDTGAVDDVIHDGGGGSDTLRGGGGNDVITVTGGTDQANGGDGVNDILIVDWLDAAEAVATGAHVTTHTNGSGGSGSYSIAGGRSVFVMGFERIDIRTGSGNDNLYTSIGDDTLHGGGGDDTLDSGAGTDVVDGGDGIDLWRANKSLALNGSGAIVYDLRTNSYVGPGSVSNVERVDLTLGTGADVVVTSLAILGDTVNGGGGDDTLTASGGSDIMIGGEGQDLLIVEFTPDTTGIASSGGLFGGVNAVTGIGNASGTYRVQASSLERLDIRTGSGVDSIVGGAGVDTINTGAGADTLTGGGGADRLTGGSGADTFVVGLNTDSTPVAPDVITDFVTGEDLLSLTGLAGAAYVVIQQSTNGSVVLVDADANGVFETQILLTTSITASDVIAGVGVTAIGDGANQVLRGTTRVDALAGGGGDDQIAGGDGGDSLYGQDGADVIYGQDGADFAYGGIGADAIVGGLGGDSLLGEDGNDSLFGEAGADLLIGGEGTDGLYGGLDNDTLLGGAANDTLLGEEANDQLFGDGGADLLIGGAGVDILFGGADNDALVGGSEADTLNGEAGADQLYGDAGVDTLVGAEGNDTVFGGADGDTLFGSEGGDTLNGEDGADLLIGGAGGDVLIGGAGGDLFLFQLASDSTNAQADLIADFAKGFDLIDLSQVDANMGVAGDQAFVFVTGALSAGRARLTYDAASNRSLFEGDVTGDGVADLVFLINGNVGAGDGFVL